MSLPSDHQSTAGLIESILPSSGAQYTPCFSSNNLSIDTRLSIEIQLHWYVSLILPFKSIKAYIIVHIRQKLYYNTRKFKNINLKIRDIPISKLQGLRSWMMIPLE